MSEYLCDAETQEMILEMVAGAASTLGVGAAVTVPGVVLGKLIIRMADSGVTIPDNEMLTDLQEQIRSQEELPG